MSDKTSYNPTMHHRHSIRLRGYDYSHAGAYFITICTQNRERLFGEITDGEMKMNDAGQMVQTVWDEMPNRFDGLELDRFVVMPNHIHGIIVLPRRGESCIRPCIRPFISPGIHAPIHSDPTNGRSTDHGGDFGGHDHRGDHGGDDRKGDHKDRPYGTLPGTVGRIFQAFKSITTHEYTNGVKQHGWLPFPGKLWQRNYWEHIVRNESELSRIRDYVKNNPVQWESDRLYRRPTGRINGIRETATEYELEEWMA
jgi:REP element-mobilizing transposase RayT